MMIVISYLTVIILNVKGLNFQSERYKVAALIKNNKK